ncbi:MAG: hypothetical protein P4M12_07545 [Gammaproteobacteria bacterium]|nr:hypothetical protein [Gammaproteobacteria bacterium]
MKKILSILFLTSLSSVSFANSSAAVNINSSSPITVVYHSCVYDGTREFCGNDQQATFEPNQKSSLDYPWHQMRTAAAIFITRASVESINANFRDCMLAEVGHPVFTLTFNETNKTIQCVGVN